MDRDPDVEVRRIRDPNVWADELRLRARIDRDTGAPDESVPVNKTSSEWPDPEASMRACDDSDGSVALRSAGDEATSDLSPFSLISNVCKTLVLYPLQLMHLWYKKWNLALDFFSQSLQ